MVSSMLTRIISDWVGCFNWGRVRSRAIAGGVYFMPARLSDQTMESAEFRYFYLQIQICFSSMPPEAVGIPSKKVPSFPVSIYLFVTQRFHTVRIVFTTFVYIVRYLFPFARIRDY